MKKILSSLFVFTLLINMPLYSQVDYDCAHCPLTKNTEQFGRGPTTDNDSFIGNVFKIIGEGIRARSSDQVDPMTILTYVESKTQLTQVTEQKNDESKKTNESEIMQIIKLAESITTDTRLSLENRADLWMNISILYKIIGARQKSAEQGKLAMDALNQMIKLTPTRPKSIFFFASAMAGFKDLNWATRKVVTQSLGLHLDQEIKRAKSLLLQLPESNEREYYLNRLK